MAMIASSLKHALAIWVLLCSWALAEVISTSGNIDFDIDDDGFFEAKLNSSGLAVGGNISPSANLHVSGNALVTKKLSIGTETSSSANLFLSGTLSHSIETISSSQSIGDYGTIAAGNSSDNIKLTFPGASVVGDGRVYTVKKTISINRIIIDGGGGSLIDGFPGYELTSGNLGSLSMVSHSGNWFILSKSAADNITLLFEEDFETPVVSMYDEGNTPSGWVRGDQGFNSNRHGLHNEDSGEFTNPGANNDQGYSLRYSTTGITSDEDVFTIGTYKSDLTYRISFEVVMDENDPTEINYSVALIAFPEGGLRNDTRNNTNNGMTQLAISTGTAPVDGSVTAISFDFSPTSAFDANLGRDLGIRLRGSNNGSIVDTVRVIVIPNN